MSRFRVHGSQLENHDGFNGSWFTVHGWKIMTGSTVHGSRFTVGKARKKW
jgi:hypothetical protein